MFRKTRIRSLVAISALTGATVLGGAGLAGAAGGDADTDADTLEPTSVIDAGSVLADDDELNTGEPEAPTLPDQAAQQAHDALAKRFAGGTGQDAEDDAQDSDAQDSDTQESGTADGAIAEQDPSAEEQGTHGEQVSAVATSGSGEGHGGDVSEVARQQGEERRQAAPEDRPERGGEEETTEEADETAEER